MYKGNTFRREDSQIANQQKETPENDYCPIVALCGSCENCPFPECIVDVARDWRKQGKDINRLFQKRGVSIEATA